MRGSSVEDEFDKGLFKFIPRLGPINLGRCELPSKLASFWPSVERFD